MLSGTAGAQSVRETIRLDDGWKFAFGNASDPAKDFGCGTEYFNYLTKANSIHNEGPYSRGSKGAPGVNNRGLASDLRSQRYE